MSPGRVEESASRREATEGSRKVQAPPVMDLEATALSRNGQTATLDASGEPQKALRGLCLVGGQQHTLRPLTAGVRDWYRYAKGVVVEVALPSQKVKVVHEYVSPPEVCPAEDPAILFKSGTLEKDLLYLCTQTEVLVYRLPEFTLLHYISLPIFNDVHHVRPTPDGTLVVANTGLDMVVEVTLGGEVVREWSALDTNTWEKFSRSIDYRRVASTKPHASHPNNVFYVGSELWVTRFEQRDALCLTTPGKRIDIGLERMHDGVVHDGLVYFTTVDGKVAITNPETLRVEEIWDLNEVSADGDLLGWCRGLHIEDGKLWIGFSRLRATKFRANVSWVVQGFKKILPTRLACYDLERRSLDSMVDVEPYGMSAVFSVLPLRG